VSENRGAGEVSGRAGLGVSEGGEASESFVKVVIASASEAIQWRGGLASGRSAIAGHFAGTGQKNRPTNGAVQVCLTTRRVPPAV
jgi:hypothetical protein